MERKQLLIERAIDGLLTEGERKEFDSLFKKDASFAELYDERAKIGQFLSKGIDDSFSPFFADRVVKSLVGIREEVASLSLVESLVWSFKRVALISSFAVLALASFNTMKNQSDDTGRSFVEKAFDIPAVTLDAAQEDFGSIIQ